MNPTTLCFFIPLLVLSAHGKNKYVDYEHVLEKAHYPKNFTTMQTLDEFIRLVNEHKLNVSLIMSNGENYEEGNLKEVMAMTLTFPVNSESTTKATLKKEDFDKLAEIANKEKITVAGSISKNNERTVISNNRKAVPITRAYKIFTSIKNGKCGFVFDEKNYAAQYTFHVHGADGKNTTTKVFYGDVDVDVLVSSENIKEDQLTVIKKSLVDAYFTFEPEMAPKALSAMLAKNLPGHEWDVAQTDGRSYVDSDLWVKLKIVGDEFLVYKD